MDSSNVSIFDFNATMTINVAQWIIVGTGLPLIVVAIFALYSLVKEGQVAPVYIINLFLSDLIQLCCLVAENLGKSKIIDFIYIFGLFVSIGFMVCVSLERYLVIAWPLWYRFRRNIKTSVAVSVVIWTLPLVFLFLMCFQLSFQISVNICAAYLVLPLPLFIFFLVGSLKALSAARSVSEEEKRRIVAMLVVVLLIYTVLFLPSVIWFLVAQARKNPVFFNVTFILLSFSPLADLFMYVFIKKSATDRLLASLCFCKTHKDQQISDMSSNSTGAQL